MLNITLVPFSQVNDGIRMFMSVTEAARELNISEATIRRSAAKAGVKKFSGRTTRGGVVIDAHPFPIIITYSK